MKAYLLGGSRSGQFIDVPDHVLKIEAPVEPTSTEWVSDPKVMREALLSREIHKALHIQGLWRGCGCI